MPEAEQADDLRTVELAEVKALAGMGLWDHTRGSAEDQSLIPRVVFYENTKQNSDLCEMARDLVLGEHILLVGNQGVGKNKLADYLTQVQRIFLAGPFSSLMATMLHAAGVARPSRVLATAPRHHHRAAHSSAQNYQWCADL